MALNDDWHHPSPGSLTLCRALLAPGPGLVPVPWQHEVCALVTGPRNAHPPAPRARAGRGSSLTILTPQGITIVPLERPDLLQLELEEDDCVLEEGAEHEDDAGDHPALDRGQTLGLKMKLFCHL